MPIYEQDMSSFYVKVMRPIWMLQPRATQAEKNLFILQAIKDECNKISYIEIFMKKFSGFPEQW